MARWTSRHRRASVDCYTVDNVTRIIQQPERTPAPPIDLPQDLEFTRRCMCSVYLAVVHVWLLVAGGNGQYPQHTSALINDKQYLPFQINLDVSISGIAWNRTACTSQSCQLIQGKFSGDGPSFNFLEGYQCMSRIRVKLAVDGTGPITQIG